MSDIPRSGAFGDHAPNIKWIVVELSSDATRHEINRRREGYLMTRKFALVLRERGSRFDRRFVRSSMNPAQASGTITSIMGYYYHGVLLSWGIIPTPVLESLTQRRHVSRKSFEK
jgi:hypothetical protein